MNFKPLRLAVVLLGDRLAVAALQGSRLEAFTVEVENPAASLRAELDARRLPARKAFLAVARSVVTVKPIDLPPVAGDMHQMVGFELERHLPFSADDASYDFTLLPAEAAADRPAGGEQRVLITAADRRVVETAVRLADEARLRPQSLTVAAHNLPTLARVPRAARVAWVHRAAGATDVLLLAGDTLMLSRSLPGIEDALVADEIARMDPDVKAVDRVLRDLERKRKLLATVDSAEAAGIRPLLVLRELTEILPNDAWLTTVSLDAKGVELTGAASAASALIPLLENSPRLERVEFSSPVTRGRDNREQFRIRAAWERAGATAVATGAAPAPAPTPPPPGVVAPAPPPSPGGPAPAPAQPRRPAGPPPGGARQ